MFTSRGWIAGLGLTTLIGAFACGGGSDKTPGGGGGTAPVMAGSSGVAGSAAEPEGGAGGTGPEGCDCDDNIICTLDECVDGQCFHTPQHFQCLGGSYCSLTEGCARGDACATDEDCERPDTCVTVSCDPKTARCSFKYLDTDGDGEAPLVCAGKDCNDAEFWVHSDAPETCDGIDNDCDGVLDPAKDSGCLSGESCVAAVCACDGATSSCETGPDEEDRVCVDLAVDGDNCGRCGAACDALEVCKEGSCACEEPRQRCDGQCRDLSSDGQHCGECGVSCGNGACAQGECACGQGRINCGTAQYFDCRDTQTDPRSCGGCGLSCLVGTGCRLGDCDADVELVRLYGAYDLGLPNFGGFRVAAGPNGSSFVGLSSTGGDQYQLPGGQTPAWSGYAALAKLDASADIVWTVPSTAVARALVSAGEDVWAAFNASSDITVGDKTFTRKAQHQAMVVLVKLRGSTGEIIAEEQLDLPASGGSLWLTADADGAWVAFDTSGDVGHGATTFAQLEGYPSLLFGTSSGATRWLPGSVRELALDPNGKVFVAIETYASNGVTLGGQPFSPTAKLGQWAVARYTKQLLHEASFLMPASFQAAAVTPGSGSVLWLQSAQGFLQETDYTGASLGSGGESSELLGLVRGRTQAGKVFTYGWINETGAYAGRNLPKNHAVLLKLDAATKVIEGSIAFDTDANLNTQAYIEDMAVTADGKGATLVAPFDDAVLFQGGATYAAAGYSGIAIVKVKLPMD